MRSVNDSITVVGSSYYQPIADLVDKLLSVASRRPPETVVSHAENGYAAATCVLLVALLESFSTRVRFKRGSEIQGTPSIPDLLIGLFPAVPSRQGLHEVFLLRNIVVHNHLWHLDHSDESVPEPATIARPPELGFSVNRSYESLVNSSSRKTVHLGLWAVPTWVGVRDVQIVFHTVWETLEHMNEVSYDHTPLAGRQVGFRGARRSFEELLHEFPSSRGAA